MTRTALYRHFDANDRLIYVGISDCLSARDKQHAATSHWHGFVARTETTWCETRHAALIAEWEAIRDEDPIYNLRRVEPFRRKERAEKRRPKQDDLAAYIAKIGARQQDFALRVGISRSYVNELLHGHRVPSLDVAQRIAAETEGAVSLRSWPNLAAIADAIAAEDAQALRGAA